MTSFPLVFEFAATVRGATSVTQSVARRNRVRDERGANVRWRPQGRAAVVDASRGVEVLPSGLASVRGSGPLQAQKRSTVTFRRPLPPSRGKGGLTPLPIIVIAPMLSVDERDRHQAHRRLVPRDAAHPGRGGAADDGGVPA